MLDIMLQHCNNDLLSLFMIILSNLDIKYSHVFPQASMKTNILSELGQRLNIGNTYIDRYIHDTITIFPGIILKMCRMKGTIYRQPSLNPTVLTNKAFNKSTANLR